MPTAERVRGRALLPGAVAAALATVCVFLTSLRNEFLELDDLGYVVGNRFIDTLDWQTVVRSFTQFHQANWHPLTMLSLAVDRQVWGMSPAGFHLTNVLFHGGTVFIACFVFSSLLTSARLSWTPLWPSSRQVKWAAVAGALFFGLHPLRVESVAWASERKDVLCVFFSVAAVWSHLRFAAGRAARPERPAFSFGPYRMTLLAAGLALLSKPTAVSLPLLLLLLDWYPLGRMSDRRGASRAVAEKVPLLLMAAGTAALTLLAQQEAIRPSADLTALSRLLVACKAVVFYLWKTAWPTGLAPSYPHPGNVTAAALPAYLAFAAAVAACSVAAWLMATRQPLWPALWLFFLLALAPTLGVVQAGGQWAADRYTYLPSLGLALLWGGGGVWLFGRLKQRGRRGIATALLLFAGAQVLGLALLTLRQISLWRTTETIATREIELFPRQVGAAYLARARYRNETGRYAQALEDADEALAIALRKGLAEVYADVSSTRERILGNLKRLP